MQIEHGDIKLTLNPEEQRFLRLALGISLRAMEHLIKWEIAQDNMSPNENVV